MSKGSEGAIVDFSSLELHKENILPLATGRSASQLVSLSSQSRSGLGDKLKTEHERFQNALDCLERFENGESASVEAVIGWEMSELVIFVDDPLDLHHQYARFVINSYPAGPSSESKLLPILEKSTRKFLNDERYKNDPRYLRLWNLYSKNIEEPQECYKFLFAKGIGERLAVLYEEYALVLEAAGKRQQADQIYLLGQARQAVPMERLKKRHQAFQARMLVAPALPDSPPPASASTSATARSVLSVAGPSVGLINFNTPSSSANGRGFAVFSDGGGDGEAPSTPSGDWQDFGTVKTRKRENVVEATEWKGETLTMSGRKAIGGMKLEVFRDEGIPQTPSKLIGDSAADVLGRSLRGPTEGELLRKNPFKNYSLEDLNLSSIDPLQNIATIKPSSSKSSRKEKPIKVVSSGNEKVACDLKAIYPAPGVEVSFEEIKFNRNLEKYQKRMESWNNWEWFGIWRMEIARTGQRSYLIDSTTGWPQLYDSITQEPLWDFIRALQPPPEPSPSPEPIRVAHSPRGSPIALNDAYASPVQDMSTRTRREPSPTMNTKQAQAMVDNLFSKTLTFEDGRPIYEEEEEEEEEEEDQYEEEEEEETPEEFESQSQSLPESYRAESPEWNRNQDENANSLPTPAFARTPLGPRFKVASDFETQPALSVRDGFDMGRRALGGNKYADFIDAMTPITERTCEYNTFSAAKNPVGRFHLGGRISVAPDVRAVLEEEDEEEEEYEEEDEIRDSGSSEDEDGDVGFVEEEDEIIRGSGGSEEESEEENQVLEPAGNYSRPHAVEVVAREGDGSYDSASVGEGYSIAGNQSGMNTDMIVLTEEFTSLSTTPASKFSNPCNPFDSAIMKSILEQSSPSIYQHSTFHDLSKKDSKKLEVLQKYAKSRADKPAPSRNKRDQDKTGVIEEILSLQLDEEFFSVGDKLGEGGFGAVFRFIPIVDKSFDDSFDDEEEEEEISFAVKIEKPSNLWEFYILTQLNLRLPPSILQSIINVHSLYHYRDESFLFLEFSSQGTLLDAVNKANDAGTAPPTAGASSGLEEIVAIFFTLEIIKIIQEFHSKGFVHGDLKIDNCLVRLEKVPLKSWSGTYDPSGEGGWSAKGIKIIDFGKSIDVAAFGLEAGEQEFKTNFETTKYDCVEMREEKSWTYEPDYFGIAAIAFTLLFGRFIETKTIDGRVHINQNFKRYHQSELWGKLFEALLNPRSASADGKLPMTDELELIRAGMESWLIKNCEKNGKSLKGLLKKMEIYSLANFGK